MEGMETNMALVWCEKCLEYHKLFPGIGAPMYWCQEDLMYLETGQEIAIMSKGKFRGR